MIIMFGLGLLVFAGFVPPPEPVASAADIAAIYRAHGSMILLGMVLLMMAAVLFVPFFAAIGFQMARIEGPQPILAVVQVLIGVVTAVMALLPSIAFAAAAFRVDRSPDLILLMNDLGWLILLWPFAPAFFQNLVIAVCVFSDKSRRPLFPRWVGYFNVMDAMLFLPGALIPLYKSGPFAWNGLLGFYIPMASFFVWVLGMAVATTKAIKRLDPAG